MLLHVALREPPDLYFEDFAEGQEFAEVVKGPMLVGHQVRWAGACDNYDAEYHHDEYVAKAMGLPGIILSGPLMASYLMTAVSEWTGRNGRFVKFFDQNKASTMPRDMAYVRGRVRRKYQEDGRNLLDVECSVTNQDGKVTTPGAALIEFPARQS